MTVEVRVERDGEVSVITVSGDVDLYSSPDMRKAITAQAKKKVPVIVINLQDVDYMDSSGVATLVEGLQLAGRYNGSFRIAGLKESVREVFELSRLDKVFSIYEDLGEARQAD